MQKSVSEQLLCKKLYKAEILRKNGDIKIDWEQFRCMDFTNVFYVSADIKVVDMLDIVVSKCKELYASEHGVALNAQAELSIKSYLRKYLSKVVQERYIFLGIMDFITIESEYSAVANDSLISEAATYALSQLQNKVPVILCN